MRAIATVILFLVSSQIHALNLSRPDVLSKMGEPLHAEILISDISAAEAKDLRANLADSTIFQTARVAINPALNNAEFKLITKSETSQVLQITGKAPVKEPYLEVLIDLRWASGRMVRNLSMLVAETPKAGPEKANKESAPADNAKPIKKSPPPQRTANSNDPDAVKVLVKSGDTASEIIEQHQDDTVSLDQMLLALLRSNPDAFVADNVNRLKAGAVLTIPKIEQARSISRKEGRENIQLQSKDFDAYRASVATRLAQAKIDQAGNTASGSIQGQVKNNKTDPKDQLKLSKPDSKDADAIAKQKEAEEVAKRAEEISKNVNELGKIAQASANVGDANSKDGLSLSTAMESVNGLINSLSKDSRVPLAAGCLVAFLLLIGWIKAKSKTAELEQELQEVQAQNAPPPELKIDFDLDLPPHPKFTDTKDSPSPTVNAYTHNATYSSVDSDSALEDPFKVRLDLAEELWKLGQKHTSRALAQEVADQASPDLQAQAKRWLAEKV